MFKHTITYTNFNDEEVTETLYFHLSASEIADLQSAENSLFDQTRLEQAVKTKDSKELYSIFKTLIKESYGEKSSDGRMFIKIDKDGHRLVDDFMLTAVYDEFFMELISNEALCNKFISEIIPANLAEKIKAIEDKK